MYPIGKGDPLCPLGFHPQVRWPTRCKRCFRDYKEHGGKRRDEDNLRRDDITGSTPTLSAWSTRDGGDSKRSWASSTNLSLESKEKRSSSSSSDSGFSNPSSWTSTPDLANLEDDTQANVPTVNVTLPKRKAKPIDTGQRTVSDSISVKLNRQTVFNKNDSLAARAKKLQAFKDAANQQQEKTKRIHVKEIKAVVDEPTNHDVQFLIKVKTKPPLPEPKPIERPETPESDDDTISMAGTETTDTTLVDHNEFDLRSKYENVKKELEEVKSKCDRLEREKSDIFLRRLTAMESTSSKTAEVLKLQQRCNEQQSQLEDYKDEKKALDLRVKELEEELDSRPTAAQAQKIADELRSKLLAAETLCEELMDENEDMKKELRDMEDEMEEMQDNFREDQADEYTSLKKELEQTTKNCRILSFKLRKAERKAEELEKEKAESEKKLKEISGGQSTLSYLDRIKQLENDLANSKEASLSLQKKLDETNSKLSKAEEVNNSTTKKKAPMLSAIAKSETGKISRESLTRGGSQDDPAQLLRDLQDSMEREADLREQLKFAEEEAQNLRKKASRIEDDNESLVLQLKKMATRARSRKLSPNRLTPDPLIEKDEGISEDEDPTNLKLQLELSEQEAAVLRKKVEEFQTDSDRMKKKVKELQDKLTMKTAKQRLNLEKGDDKKNSIHEEEISELKKKLIEKERDIDRLNAEISLSQKRPKVIQKAKSLDLDQSALDLKRQVQLMEQETTVLKSKLQSLEAENEKLSAENKKLQLLRGAKALKSDKSLDKYIDKIAELEVDLNSANEKIKELESKKDSITPKLEIDSVKLKKIQIEKDKLAKTLEKLKADSIGVFKDRVPKKPGELTTKAQLKTWVLDLENEIGEVMVVLKNAEAAKSKLQEELEEAKKSPNRGEDQEMLKKKIKELEQEISDQKTLFNKEKSKIEDLEKKLLKSKEALMKACEDRDHVKIDLDKIKNDKKSVEEELVKVKAELKAAGSSKSELDKKEKEILKQKDELEEKLKQANKELTTKTKKFEELEKKLKELQDTTSKQSTTQTEEIKKLKTMIEEEKSQNKINSNKHSELSDQWQNDRNLLNSKISELKTKCDDLENTLKTKESFVKKLEETLQSERLASKEQKNSNDSKEITKLKDELNKLKSTLSETETKVEMAQKAKKAAEDKLRKLETDGKAEKLALEKKSGELEIDLQNEKKKLDIMKTNSEKDQKNKELELASLKSKIKALELNTNMGSKKITEIKTEYQERIDKLEQSLASEKKEYEDLTAKYEILEEEHVVTKAKLVMEKETLNNQLVVTKHELECVENELQKLRETYNSKNDAWIKEKLDMQEKLKDFEKKKPKEENSNLETMRLKAFVQEKQSELDQLRKEYDVIHDQMDYLRKENDELKKKLDDFDKVHKIQRTMSADSTAMENQIKQLKIKLNNLEKTKKSDVAECKMRYENQISVINEELRSLQSQVTRFKRERDTYKHMLEGAQKTIGDLKQSPKSGRESRASLVSLDEMEEWKSKVATLEQQISCMEDELSEARLEGSKLKTELVSERSSYEIKLSELNSRVNELEEEKVLSSGRTKIAGIRTRMELSWQKEREEQQRLLQETATLARDLRQTLFEVERERDKERLEAKRKQEQLKKTSEEDQEETKRKLTELQCDLLELRDAHAKLRTTNEKLRREKEKHEREREEMKLIINGRRRLEQEDDKRINALIEQVESLVNIAPELVSAKERDRDGQAPYTPTPPRRTKGPKSRESSPGLERSSKEASLVREDKKSQIQSTMQRIIDVTEELKRYQRLTDEDRERDRLKKVMGMRRATSTEHENPLDYQPKVQRSYVRNGNTNSSLVRKSLSLEHSIHQDQNIWKGDDDSLSSRQSLEMSSDVEGHWHGKRDVSLDSRLSGGSTQSETGEKRKKKGFMGKLKKLTKSRSIDDQDPGHFSPSDLLSSKPSSSSDVNDETRGSKRDLKDRITGIFKRSGSSSRSNSVERQKPEIRHDTSSLQRPLMRNGSKPNVSRSSPSPSPNYTSYSSAASDSYKIPKKSK